MGIRQATQIVEEWRAAERRLALRDPDAADFEELCRAVERLRREYQRVGAMMAPAKDPRPVVGSAN